MAVVRLPGLIDPHVHLRDPGQTHKEDFLTGTQAALAGGFTTIFDMPNNKEPIFTKKALDKKINAAKKAIVCDVGFYFGSLGDNLKEFEKVKKQTRGLKLYLNETTGNLLVDRTLLLDIFLQWRRGPILVHAEDEAVSFILKLVEKTGKQTHFCHVAGKDDLKRIIHAKEKGLPITCGVTPHHLFLTQEDEKTLGPFGKMKPRLRPRKEVSFLWKNLKCIDMIESDHAPHTIEEKRGGGDQARGDTTGKAPDSAHAFERSETSGALAGRKDVAGPRAPIPFGVPGLETTLPLLLTAVCENRLTIEDIVRLCHTGPKRLLGLKTKNNTYIKVDLGTTYIIQNTNLFTKCGWTPFDGWKIKGKLNTVIVRGKKVFKDEEVLISPMFGKVLTQESSF